MLWSGLLHGRGGCRIVVGVVAWLHFVSWVLLLRGRSGRRVAVTFVALPRWVSLRCIVSQVLSLCGRSGHHVTWPWWASRYVAAVGVVVLHFVSQAP